MSALSKTKQRQRAEKKMAKFQRKQARKQELRPTFSMLKNLVPEPPLSDDLLEFR